MVPLSAYSFIIHCISSVPHASPYPTLLWLILFISVYLQIANNLAFPPPPIIAQNLYVFGELSLYSGNYIVVFFFLVCFFFPGDATE